MVDRRAHVYGSGMQDTSSPNVLALRPRTVLTVLGIWSVLLLSTFAMGPRVYTEGRAEPFWSWATWRVVLMAFGPYVLWTFVVMRCATRLSARGGRWWRVAIPLVVAPTLLHAGVAMVLWRNDDLTSFVAYASSYFVWYVAIVAVVSTLQWRWQAEAQHRELLATQLRALRAQLQPHFLFNTLHAIGVAAQHDGATASRMTALLGDLLRQTLRERALPLVSLAEEQALLAPYLQLQQLRFADRLRVDLDMPPELLGAAVPDLVLQPLVENALQHGIERRPGAGHVRVVARRERDELVLEVHDDGAGIAGTATALALGTGLGNTKARLAALFGDDAALAITENASGGTTVSVRMPWREVAHAA
jgi:hypothetical protein